MKIRNFFLKILKHLKIPEFGIFGISVLPKISLIPLNTIELTFSGFGNIENFNIQIFGILGSRTLVLPDIFSISGSRSPP